MADKRPRRGKRRPCALVASSRSGDESVAGGRVEYSIVVRNLGPEAATQVEVADILPANTTVHSAFVIDDSIDGMGLGQAQPTDPQPQPELVEGEGEGEGEGTTADSCTHTPDAGNLLICTLGDMESGSVKEISIKVDTDPAIMGGSTMTNTAEVTSATVDPATANNRDEAIIAMSSQSSLFIESSASNPNPAIGEEITYTVSVRNNGPSVARGVSIHQSLPAEMEFVDSSIPCLLEEDELGLNYACALDSLENGYLRVGQTVSVQIRAKVSDSAVCGPAWESLAWTKADNMNGHSFADESVAAGCFADVRAFQFGNGGGALPAGQPLTMTFMAENVGADVAQNVGMELLIEHASTFDVLRVNPNVFGDRGFASCDVFTATNIQNGSKAIRCELDDEFEVLDMSSSGEYNGGGRWLIHVVIQSAAGGPFTTSATVTTTTEDPVMENNTVTSESLASVLASVIPPLDTDGDTIPDYKDVDADNDGLTNAMEGDQDSDADGTPDFLDNDSDADGIDDAYEGDVDTDEDGTPDFRDDDSDADGIPDSVEGVPSQPASDESGNALPEDERSQDEVADLDNDGIPDFQDTDSDNDTIPDSIEGNTDSDSDGIPDYRDEDSDNDGTLDRLESVLDANNNGIADYRDPDVQTIRPDAGNALAAFTARYSEDDATVAQDGAVTLQWQTIDESGTTGFTVYRSSGSTGQANTSQVAAQSALLGGGPIPADAAKLNQTPMAPTGSGSSYSYTDQFGDAASVDGQSYSYWIEETKADGTTVVHGPVEVRIGGSQLSPAVMLPFVTN